jgi:DNA-directed RNA polymerase subunit omega
VARITVEDCLENISSRFALTMLVSKRAKQLMKGAQTTVDSDDNKFIVSALREVAQGTVTFDSDASRGTIIQQIEHDLNR